MGVHIADVTYFVKENSALDIEAAKRSTTVYLVDKRTDMLPKLLTEKLCSLRCKEEKLAFSCLIEVCKDTFTVKASKFVKSIIYSKASLSYSDANQILKDHQSDT